MDSLLTERRKIAIDRLRKYKKLHKILGIILENMMRETSELAQPLCEYVNNEIQWQFYFPYAFDNLYQYIFDEAKKLFETHGIKIHAVNNNIKGIVFYLTEDELETYYVMNKLI